MQKVHYARSYDPAGIETQERVEESLDLAGISTSSFNASLLQEPWETKNGSGNPFQVLLHTGVNPAQLSIANRLSILYPN